jgi:hypothetical protein
MGVGTLEERLKRFARTLWKSWFNFRAKTAAGSCSARATSTFA